MTTDKLAETKDGWAASVLTADLDTSISEQSGETFCWETDDVFTDEGLYEYEDDLYPDVNLVTVREDDGEYLAITFGQDIIDGNPNYEDLMYSLEQTSLTEGVTPVDHTLVLYEFTGLGDYFQPSSLAAGNVPGTLVPQIVRVAVADMWEHADGASALPTWNHFRARYTARYLGGSATHSWLSAIDPVDDVIFVGATPDQPANSGFVWPYLGAQFFSEFVFAGTRHQHAAEPSGVLDYAPWVTGSGAAGGGFGALRALYSKSRINAGYRRALAELRGVHARELSTFKGLSRAASQLFTGNVRGRNDELRRLRGRLWSGRGIRKSMIRSARSTGLRSLPFGGPAHLVGTSAIASAGHDIGYFDITPVDEHGFRYPSSRITLVVD